MVLGGDGQGDRRLLWRTTTAAMQLRDAISPPDGNLLRRKRAIRALRRGARGRRRAAPFRRLRAAAVQPPRPVGDAAPRAGPRSTRRRADAVSRRDRARARDNRSRRWRTDDRLFRPVVRAAYQVARR